MGQDCEEREFLAPDERRSGSDDVIEDSGRAKVQRFSREKAEGTRDRDSARITGAVQRTPCAQNMRCSDQNTCMPRPTNSKTLLNAYLYSASEHK